MLKATNNLTGELKSNIEDAFFDDSDQLFVAYHEHGPFMVLVSQSWEAACMAMVDSMETVDESELYEAYGFDSQEAYAAAGAESSLHDWTLSEGYEYQSNATGTGIVNVGHYVTVSQMDWAGWDLQYIVKFPYGMQEWTIKFGCTGCSSLDCCCEENQARAELVLTDDGTMDTVFKCTACSETLRFGSMSEHRDEHGALAASGWMTAFDSHWLDCAGNQRTHSWEGGTK